MCYRSKVSATGGFSLIEVVLVILIMGILASVAAQKYSGAVEQSRFDATRDEMDRIAVAVVGDADLTSGGVRSDFGYVGDVGGLPANLDALVTNPGGYATWHGPYIQSDFQQNPNDYKQDAWGLGYTYSGGVTLSSTGSGSTVTKSFASSTNDLLHNTVSGGITDGLNNVPGDSAARVTVKLAYPNGAGATTTASTQPSAGGSFSFSGTVPVGNQLLTVIYQGDTVQRYVSVLPGSVAVTQVRLPGDLWTPAQGTGGGGGGLAYVAASANSPGGNHMLQFQVINNSGIAIDLTSIKLTFAAPIYFQKILISGNQIFNDTNPRGASGEVKSFSTVTVNNGASLTIDYQTFKQCVSGSCGNGNVSGQAFTALFSDGSSVTFTAP